MKTLLAFVQANYFVFHLKIFLSEYLALILLDIYLTGLKLHVCTKAYTHWFMETL